jgi:hypothetical protein
MRRAQWWQDAVLFSGGLEKTAPVGYLITKFLVVMTKSGSIRSRSFLFHDGFESVLQPNGIAWRCKNAAKRRDRALFVRPTL